VIEIYFAKITIRVAVIAKARIVKAISWVIISILDSETIQRPFSISSFTFILNFVDGDNYQPAVRIPSVGWTKFNISLS
jgi:hypothetical protein